MRLEAEGNDPGLAVSRNLSTSGMLMATATKLEVGAPVRITFRVGEEDEHTAEGSIVRVGTNDEDPHGLWPFVIAVQFFARIDELAPVLSTYQPVDES